MKNRKISMSTRIGILGVAMMTVNKYDTGKCGL